MLIFYLIDVDVAFEGMRSVVQACLRVFLLPTLSSHSFFFTRKMYISSI